MHSTCTKKCPKYVLKNYTEYHTQLKIDKIYFKTIKYSMLHQNYNTYV